MMNKSKEKFLGVRCLEKAKNLIEVATNCVALFSMRA